MSTNSRSNVSGMVAKYETGNQEDNVRVLLKKGSFGSPGITESHVGSGVLASEFSDHARSFFGNLKKNGTDSEENVRHVQKPTIDKSEEILGARAPEPEEVMQLREQSSYDSLSRRAGLYDVFAPAGPIGIVVDTTKNGPAVHSLKRTSPMLGLINPGDLIVGLDDEDTRGMTAATLTRLMAKKSSQKERKITLLTLDY
jgi:hypothetical protein